MEKKRKLPPRAAARAEQAAKRRTLTPPQRSETPTPAPAPERDPTPVEEAPPPLPTSITPGKPLPTVESPQPDDLSNAEYQTVTERYDSLKHESGRSIILSLGTDSLEVASSQNRCRAHVRNGPWTAFSRNIGPSRQRRRVL
jgi:hypothetical protein